MCCPFCGSDNPSPAGFCRACGAELPRLSASGEAGGGAGGDSTDALPVGTLLGGTYAVKSVLGQGGFGITYCARDQMLDRQVAIKEFFPAGCRREDALVRPARGLSDAHFGEARAQFLAEARLLARCHHAGIVGVHTAFETNATAYMVMELLHGSHLAQLLEARGGTLPEAEAVRLIERAGEALQFVHDQGLLHRDIKPENIIATDDGRVMLIDFGTAREYAQGQAQGHTIVVTPGYAPLEQYAKQAKRGAFTDVYGLAATLYHLLTGQAPPAASDRAVGVQLRPVREENPQISAGVARAIEAGLEMEIAKRPQSVREFLALMHAPALQTATAATAVEVALMPRETAIAKAQREALLALSSPPAGFFSGALQARQQMLNEALADPQPALPVQLLPLLAPQQIASPPASSSVPSAATGNRVGGILNKPITVADNTGKSVVWLFGGITAFIGFVVWSASSPPSAYPPYSQPPMALESSPNYSSSTYRSFPTASPPKTNTLGEARKEMESAPAILPISVETLPISPRVPTTQATTSARSNAPTARVLSEGLARFSPDGRMVAYLDLEAVLRVWSLSSHRVVSSLPQPKNHPPTDIRFSPDGKTVALTYQTQGEHKAHDRVSVWNLMSRKFLGTLSVDPRKEWLIARDVLFDGRVVIAKGDLGKAELRCFLWDPRTGKQSDMPMKGIADRYRVAVSADGQQLVTGDRTGHIRWWDAKTGVQKAERSTNLTYQNLRTSPSYASKIPAGVIVTDPLPVGTLHFSRNGSYSAISNLVQIRVFDSKAREIGALPIGHSPAFAVSPDGKWVVEGGSWRNPERTMLWNVSNLQKIRLQAPAGEVKAWSFSPDGKQITGLSSSPGMVSLVTWNTDAEPIAPFSAARITPFPELDDRHRSVRAVSLTNNLVAEQDGQHLEIRRFDGSLLNSLVIAESLSTGVDFSPDGRLLSSQALSGAMRLWDVRGGLQVAQLESLAPMRGERWRPIRYHATRPLFSADSSLMARVGSVAGKNLVEVWSLKPTPLRIASLPLSQPLTALTFSADGRALIYGDEMGHLHCYDVAAEKLVAQTQNSPAPILQLFPTQQGLAVVSGATADKPGVRITQYDLLSSGGATGLPAGQQRWVLKLKNRVILNDTRSTLASLAISPDGQFAATAPNFNFNPTMEPGNGITLWHLPTGSLMRRLPIEMPVDDTFSSGPSGPSSVEDLNFSPDGSQLHCTVRDMARFRRQALTWQLPPRQKSSD